mmetsp:Transcript_70639/g.134473  ORF Transcript_70639/g.134473 Transcript_70639/m.134473 type:complete len:186 (+) Transcript_70639:117-674(+)
MSHRRVELREMATQISTYLPVAVLFPAILDGLCSQHHLTSAHSKLSTERNIARVFTQYCMCLHTLPLSKLRPAIPGGMWMQGICTRQDPASMVDLLPTKCCKRRSRCNAEGLVMLVLIIEGFKLETLCASATCLTKDSNSAPSTARRIPLAAETIALLGGTAGMPFSMQQFLRDAPPSLPFPVLA